MTGKVVANSQLLILVIWASNLAIFRVMMGTFVVLEWLRYIAYKLPAIVSTIWIVLLIVDSIRTHPKIREVAKKYDPNAEFVRRRDYGMGFASNSFWVDRKHPRCTEEFLREWDDVYGSHWRRMIFGFVLLPVIAGVAHLGRDFLRTFLY